MNLTFGNEPRCSLPHTGVCIKQRSLPNSFNSTEPFLIIHNYVWLRNDSLHGNIDLFAFWVSAKCWKWQSSESQKASAINQDHRSRGVTKGFAKSPFSLDFQRRAVKWEQMERGACGFTGQVSAWNSDGEHALALEKQEPVKICVCKTGEKVKAGERLAPLTSSPAGFPLETPSKSTLRKWTEGGQFKKCPIWSS